MPTDARDKVMTYMLRRFLHRYNYKETVDETAKLCPRYRIDEVMWIPVAEMPPVGLEPLDRVKSVLPCLHYAHEQMAAVGVASSINVFFTLGHGDYGVNTAALHPGMEFMVDPTGAQARMSACPLSPYWREWVCEMYRMLASTKPVRLWVDDDFRNFNHGPVKFGCYCGRHLEAFGRLIGRTLTREELVEAILRPGKPRPWRPLWLNLLQETLAEAARMLTRAVQEVSPETEMGWMSTTADWMALEGRDPAVQLKALVRDGDAQQRSAVRMSLAGYAEGNLRRFISQDTALKKVLPRLLPGTLRCSEVEGCPNSAFHKSARWYQAEMAWACVLNVPHQTFNVYDYYGGAMADSLEVGRMLRAQRPVFESLAEQAARTPKHRGVRLLHPPLSSHDVHTTAGKDMVELRACGAGWAEPLRAFGVPVAFEGTQDVMAATGQVLRSFSDGEIKDFFTRGVLLDLSALKVVEERGLGRLAGVRIAEEIELGDRFYGVEELTDPEFGGGPHNYLWWRSSDGRTVGRLELMRAARPISQLRGPDPGLVLPGVTLFENELGGRVAVSPWDYSGAGPDGKAASIFYYVPRRARQMRPVLRWLARGRLPLEVDAPGWILPHRADGDHHAFLAVMNVNMDAWNGLALHASSPSQVRAVRRMDTRGRWHPLRKDTWQQANGKVTVKLRGRVLPLGLACVVLEW